MKKEIVKTPILAYYNPKKETPLQTDASIKGLGACLLQHHKPVYFASKVLMETQQGYVAIEIESLAVAWAIEKVSSLVCKSLHSTNRSKTVGGHIIQEHEPSNTQAAKNPDKNFPL